MPYLIAKALITGAVVVAVSEIAKRSSLLAAVLASLPLTTILAMVWLYQDTGNLASVIALSKGVFWMVLPSLFFFAIFPVLSRQGLGFYPTLGLACTAMAVVYLGYVRLLDKLGIAI